METCPVYSLRREIAALSSKTWQVYAGRTREIFLNLIFLLLNLYIWTNNYLITS